MVYSVWTAAGCHQDREATIAVRAQVSATSDRRCGCRRCFSGARGPGVQMRGPSGPGRGRAALRWSRRRHGRSFRRCSSGRRPYRGDPPGCRPPDLPSQRRYRGDHFYGHGAGGVQGVTMEKDNRGTSEMAAITVDALDRPAVGAQFSALKANFSSKGQIILHGCNVAEGDSGKRLLSKLSKVAGVPVKGSNWYQIVGRSELAGNIVTASPGGSIQEDSFSGLKNLGGLPPGESLLLLGAEFSDRLLKLVGWR